MFQAIKFSQCQIPTHVDFVNVMEWIFFTVHRVKWPWKSQMRTSIGNPTIRVASAEYVQQLIDYRADPHATEVMYTEENVQLLIHYTMDPTAARTAIRAAAGATHTPNVLLTRTALAAAALMPRILQVLRNAISPQ